ncbi:MAG: hypothetical protein AAF975_09270 [Spirochaetota bacterium]
MRKSLLLFIFLISSSLSGLYAAGIGEEAVSFTGQKDKWGIGIEGGVNTGGLFSSSGFLAGFPDAWVALSLHIPKTSMLLSGGLAGTAFGSYGINANMDIFMAATQPANWFELHLFLGFGATLYSYHNGIGLSAGLRLPLGMSFWLWNWFEISLNVTPIVGLGLGVSDPIKFWLHLDAPLDLGVRFWF